MESGNHSAQPMNTAPDGATVGPDPYTIDPSLVNRFQYFDESTVNLGDWEPRPMPADFGRAAVRHEFAPEPRRGWFLRFTRVPNLLFTYLVIFWLYHFAAEPLELSWAMLALQIAFGAALLGALVQSYLWHRHARH